MTFKTPAYTLFLITLSLCALQAQTKILPIGDSITYHNSSKGWRGVLEDHLIANSVSYDFVGTNSSGQLTDKDNEGNSGYDGANYLRDVNADPWDNTATVYNDPADPVITHVESRLSNAATAGSIDYALYMLGTNTRNKGPSPTHEIHVDRNTAIWDYIWAHSPDCHIIVAYIPKITQSMSSPTFVEDYNAILASKVATLQGQGKNISIIDPGWDNGDMAGTDGLHPAQSGHDKMGNAMWTELNSLLGGGGGSGGGGGGGTSTATVYEGFEYGATANLSGQAGGSGWADSWSIGGANGTMTATSASLTSGTLPTNGNSANFLPGTFWTNATRSFSAPQGGSGNLWISFVMKNPTSDATKQAMLIFRDASNNEIFEAGRPNNQSGVRVSSTANSSWPGTSGSATSTNLFVIKVQYEADGGKYYLRGWLNPDLSAEPANWTENFLVYGPSNGDAQWAAISNILVRTDDPGGLEIDEFRVGNSFADVVTEAAASGYADFVNDAANWNGETATGELDDPDGDGLANLIEYALGSSPIAGSASPIRTVTTSGSQITFRLPKPDAAKTDVTLSLVSSTDLLNWNTTVGSAANGADWSASGATINDNGDGTINLTVNLSAKTFYRLEVSN